MKFFKNKFSLLLPLIVLFYECAWNDELIRIETDDCVLYNEDKKTSMKVSISLDFKSNEMLIENKRLYGIKKNGYGWETANIFMEPDGLDILQKVITNELSNSGYKIDDKNSENVYSIIIIINQFFLEPELQTFETNVVSIIDADVLVIIHKKKYKRRFKSIYIIKDTYWENKYELPIKENINIFSKKIISEIDNLIREKNLRNKE